MATARLPERPLLASRAPAPHGPPPSPRRSREHHGGGSRLGALPVRTGIAHVDRLTGATRWFADGLEESLGAMSTGPDGALYLPHAPLRRAFSLALGLTTEPL